MCPFQFLSDSETLVIAIELPEPFANDNFVVVAMTNQPDCYAVLTDKTSQTVTLTVVRRELLVDLNGVIHWIAIGDKSTSVVPNHTSEPFYEESNPENVSFAEGQ
ncbi:MAG: hypothetical protein A2201_08460 [Alicyclobacillus sp. RIFOXYA1_FULL_53_8]|nr:MAG: hypothetical protein A2201_08460 [Alicyclobacillus sp. RIFOXYA1_FULL_53_8]